MGGVDAAAITAGSRGLATTVLVGDFTAASLPSPTSTFSFTAAPFPVGIAAGPFSLPTTAVAGEHRMAGMVSVELLLLAYSQSVMPFMYSRYDVIAADTVTRCQVPCHRLVFSRQGVDENCVQHVVIEDHSCCAHFCCNIFDPANLLERVSPWRYLKTIEAAAEVGFVPCRLRAVQREKRVPRFSRRGAPVQDSLVALAIYLGPSIGNSMRVHVCVHFCGCAPFSQLQFFVNFPTGTYWDGSDTKAEETHSFRVVPDVSGPGNELGHFPTKLWSSGMFES